MFLPTYGIPSETLAPAAGLKSYGLLHGAEVPFLSTSCFGHSSWRSCSRNGHVEIVTLGEIPTHSAPNEKAQVHSQTCDKLLSSIQRSLDRLNVSGCVVRDIQDGTALLHCPGIDKNEERIIQVAIRVLPTIKAVKIDTKKQRNR